MKIVAKVVAACITLNVFGEPPTSGVGDTRPNSSDLEKIAEAARVYGAHLKTNDVSRIKQGFRSSGRSDGIFNVPEGISQRDEWDENTFDVAKRNEKNDLVPLSKAEITRNRVEARPYLRAFGLNWFLLTLGQLTKQCDGVFIGVMSNVKGIDEEDKLKLKRGIGLTMEIEFQVETNLFGSVPSATVTIPVLWCDGEEQVPEKGVRVLVFYAQGYTIDVWNKAVRKFDWEKPPAKTDAPPAMLLEKLSSSVRVLRTADLERTYIGTVDGYLRLLRREKRDPDKYYAYLRTLVKSPVWRIRQDAREDMLNLLGYYGPDRFDLQRALDDPELMDIFKDYIRYIAIPGREKRHAEAQKKQ